MKKEEKKEETSLKKNSKKRDKYVAEVKKNKVKKENIFKRISRYFNGVIKETRRIRWTTGKELIKYSIAAIAFVVFFGLYFYGIDWVALLVRSLAK